MIFRLTIAHMRIVLSTMKIVKMMGVNSLLSTVEDESGLHKAWNKDLPYEIRRHILMWEFDDIPLEQVERALSIVQTRYMLSDIHILESSKGNNYHAYCFTSTEWKRAMEIIVQTDGIDWQFARLGMLRGWFTLRTGAKKTGTPHRIKTLEGYCLPDCAPEDLANWVEYETIDKGEKLNA